MLKSLWEQWKKIAEKIGDFQFNLLFSILYFIIFVPFGFVASIFSDFLNQKDFPGWVKVKRELGSLKGLKEQ